MRRCEGISMGRLMKTKKNCNQDCGDTTNIRNGCIRNQVSRTKTAKHLTMQYYHNHTFNICPDLATQKVSK